MNEEDADETTRLMSDELPAEASQGQTSRDQRHSKPVESEGNIYTVRPQNQLEISFINFFLVETS